MRNTVLGGLAALVLLGGCGQDAPTGSPDSTSSGAAAPETDSPAVIDTTPGVLTIGDTAPPLSAERWFRGTERDAVTEGRVTLVEFWATWCGPCIAVMPHISELSDTLGPEGLDVVAVSLDRGENAGQLVETFLEERSEIVSFEVMLDDGETNRTWFEAAGLRGIPSSFVVAQDGRIAWIGHPMTPATQGDGYELDRVIKGLLAGTYDIDDQASAASETEAEKASIAARVEELSAKMGELWSSGDRRGVLGYIDQIIEIDAANAHDLAQRKIEILLYELGDASEALAAARALLEGPYAEDSSMMLIMAALFSGAADPGDGGRAFAVATAREVVSMTDGTEPNSLVVLAEAQFASGEPGAAADTLRGAMGLVDEGSPAFQTYEIVLSRYLAVAAESGSVEAASGG